MPHCRLLNPELLLRPQGAELLPQRAPSHGAEQIHELTQETDWKRKGWEQRPVSNLVVSAGHPPRVLAVARHGDGTLKRKNLLVSPAESSLALAQKGRLAFLNRYESLKLLWGGQSSFDADYQAVSHFDPHLQTSSAEWCVKASFEQVQLAPQSSLQLAHRSHLHHHHRDHSSHQILWVSLWAWEQHWPPSLGYDWWSCQICRLFQEEKVEHGKGQKASSPCGLKMERVVGSVSMLGSGVWDTNSLTWGWDGSMVPMASRVGCCDAGCDELLDWWSWQLTRMAELWNRRCLLPVFVVLSSELASESDVESWDLRASLTEYRWAVLRERRDFQEPDKRFPEFCTSHLSCPTFWGMVLPSWHRNTSSSEGRVKSKVKKQSRKGKSLKDCPD